MISTFNESMKIKNNEIPVSEKVYSYPQEIQKDIFEYLKDLTDHEKKAYMIAYTHLGTSFDILRSNGFQEWKRREKK